MKMGTRSILYGAHAFYIHPFFVAWAWWRLFGAKAYDSYVGDVKFWSLPLWVSFFVHDIGYWGCAAMDDERGELHPYRGARMVFRWFGYPWYRFVLYHSRFLSKRHGNRPSLLCIADKYALTLEPWWLYLPRAIATGEIHEYMKVGPGRFPDAYPNGHVPGYREWYKLITDYARRWVTEEMIRIGDEKRHGEKREPRPGDWESIG